MRITYQIKTMKEIVGLPIISKIGLIVFLLGFGLTGISIISILVLDKTFLGLRLNPFLSGGVAFLGLIIAISFDKNRKKRTRIGVKTGEF